MRNTLYYGDNLEIMREHIADESVDLVYLDPPFNSARDYNVLFKQAKKDENQAQITAFTDTWQWSKRHYDEFFDEPKNARLFPLMNSLHDILGTSEMMAYLVMMAPRLLELHRVLRPTGSLYLHCDPVASHYLKIILDVVFGPTNFVNELTWKRTTAHSDAKKKFADIADTILLFTKTDQHMFCPQYVPHSDAYLESKYRYQDEGGRRYRLSDLRSPNPRPNLTYDYKGYKPHPNGWAVSREKMEQLDQEGRLSFPKKPEGRIQFKRYLDEMPGTLMGNVWTDISPINSMAQERMGYPTQKPLALLERMINASSNPGDIVFDPFCGCGTAVVAAEKLGRKWIGIDITFIAIDLMMSRLAKDFGLKREKDYDIIGDPKDEYSAYQLFDQSPKQFEIWAVGLVAGVPQPEKSGDKGVDGKVYFGDENREHRYAVCQVKGGHLKTGDIDAFAHVIEREKAAMGFFICLDTPTKGMYQRAEELGFFDSPSGRKIPKFQIRTIKELLEGKEFDFPRGWSLRSGGKKLVRDGEQTELGL